MRSVVVIMLVISPSMTTAADDSHSTPFAKRGYYFTFTRMPAFGLEQWKQIIDCVHADRGNTVILWMGGGFRSRRFPETWSYNQNHANVRADFAKALIDYAHARKIAVLLGLTPFGYDGVNQMSLTRSEWRATGPDGKPSAKFGFQSWGFNLCASRNDVQQFMLDYAREMCLDFYPNADGLMIESSDYAVCHCKDCGSKFYDHEFRFVNAITMDVRTNNRNAEIAVYPHYFTGAAVPGLAVKGSRQAFDAQWALFYTPHSALPDAALTKQARDALWSDDAVARQVPATIREAVQRAKREGCTGYLPSLEVFNYVPTDPEEGQTYLIGKSLKPYGFGWLREAQIPYNELPIRVNRIAYREYSTNPDLSEAAFREVLGKELFGVSATTQAVDDALFLQAVFAVGRTWCQAAPVVALERVKALKGAGRLDDRTRAHCRTMLSGVRQIETRYRGAAPAFAELHRIAKWVTEQWTAETESWLAP